MEIKDFMASDKSLKALKLLLLCLLIVSCGLDIGIIFKTILNASIALKQLSDSVSLLLLGAFVIAFDLMIFVGFLFYFLFTHTTINQRHSIFLSGVMIFIIVKEAVYFKFLSCFNFASNHLLVARSSVAVFFLVLFIGWQFSSYFYPIFKYSNVGDRSIDTCQTVFITIAIILGAVSIILNIILLSTLRATLSIDIKPENIKMGFFNQAEISSIMNGSFKKDYALDNRFVGSLSDVVYSKNSTYSHRICTYSRKSGRTCTYYYWHSYSFEITCSSETRSFYQDCEKAKSLTIQMFYLDEGLYPMYNCLINNDDQRCVSNCTKLAEANFELVLIQQSGYDQETIEPAWKGFSNCNRQPKIRLRYNNAINPCASSGQILLPKLNLFLLCCLLNFLTNFINEFKF